MLPRNNKALKGCTHLPAIYLPDRPTPGPVYQWVAWGEWRELLPGKWRWWGLVFCSVKEASKIQHQNYSRRCSSRCSHCSHHLRHRLSWVPLAKCRTRRHTHRQLPLLNSLNDPALSWSYQNITVLARDCSVLECLPSLCKALDSIPITGGWGITMQKL